MFLNLPRWFDTFIITILLIMLLPMTNLWAQAQPVALPQKILAGYTGYRLDRDMIDQVIEQILDPMQKAQFNTCDFKIQARHMDLTQPQQMRRLRELSKALAQRNLAFSTYTYSFDYIRDPKRHGHLPAFVREDGTEVPERFSQIHWQVWAHWFDGAFQLARVSRQLGIVAVKMDLERIHNTGISYDDASWNRYVQQRQFNVTIPASDRYAYLKRNDRINDYQHWFKDQLIPIAQRFEKQMHQINPDLVLGMMPAHDSWFYTPFIKHLATEKIPAIMDNWCMYSGTGYGEHVLTEQKWVKQLNPNNLFVPWFRVNNYRPKDFGIQAYHGASHTDGYSFWNIDMLRTDWPKRPAMYRLPLAYESAQYFEKLTWANEHLRADLASASQTHDAIEFQPVDTLAPPLLGLDQVPIPTLRPVGDGSGKPQTLTLRNQQTCHQLQRT